MGRIIMDTRSFNTDFAMGVKAEMSAFTADCLEVLFPDHDRRRVGDIDSQMRHGDWRMRQDGLPDLWVDIKSRYIKKHPQARHTRDIGLEMLHVNEPDNPRGRTEPGWVVDPAKQTDYVLTVADTGWGCLLDARQLKEWARGDGEAFLKQHPEWRDVRENDNGKRTWRTIFYRTPVQALGGEGLNVWYLERVDGKMAVIPKWL